MNDNYRRKDYFFPRSMREAYGYDPCEPPELQCITKHSRVSRPMLPPIVLIAALAFAVWQIIKVWGH